MATRWMKWNPTTHIFEYSTDGVTFGTLPLNASVINEGIIDPSHLPPGGISGGSNNVFTGTIPLSLESAAPVLQFKETDQTVDQRYWRQTVDGLSLRFQVLTDALVATDLMSLSRTGALNITQNATHFIGGSSGAALNRLIINNSVSGAGRYSSLTLLTDLNPHLVLNAYSSGYTTSAWDFAAGVTLSGAGAGGLSLVAANAAGSLRLYSGASATPRLTIAAAGDATFTGAITERARTTPVGEWITIPYNAADYTTNTAATWGVDAGDLRTLRYMLVGKTVTLMFTLITTSVGTPAPTELRMKIPTGLVPAYQAVAMAQIYDGSTGGWQSGVATIAAGATVIAFSKINLTTTFTASAVNTIYVYGQISFEIN
jgi:hypothetical protein